VGAIAKKDDLAISHERMAATTRKGFAIFTVFPVVITPAFIAWFKGWAVMSAGR
jgi:hypothetical protein